jgi:hypothetical protein
MIPAVVAAVTRERLLQALLWVACAVLVVAALVSVVAPRGGENRITPAALPFAFGAAALAAQALKPNNLDVVIRSWATALLFTVAALAAVYGVMMVAAVPLRLSIEGACPPAQASCPLGFDRPLSSGESFALDVAVAGGLLALMLIFMALEVYYRPRLRVWTRRKPADPKSTGGTGTGSS